MPRDAVRCFTMLTTWHWTLVDWRAKPSAKCKFSVGRFIFFGRFCGWVFPPIAWKTSLFLDIQIVGIFGFSLMNNTCSIDWIRIHRKVVAPKSVGLTITSLSGPNRSILRYNRLNQHIITRVFISLTKFFYCFFSILSASLEFWTLYTNILFSFRLGDGAPLFVLLLNNVALPTMPH